MVRDGIGHVVGLVWMVNWLVFDLRVVRVCDVMHWGVLLLDMVRDVGLLDVVRLGNLVVHYSCWLLEVKRCSCCMVRH